MSRQRTGELLYLQEDIFRPRDINKSTPVILVERSKCAWVEDGPPSAGSTPWMLLPSVVPILLHDISPRLLFFIGVKVKGARGGQREDIRIVASYLIGADKPEFGVMAQQNFGQGIVGPAGHDRAPRSGGFE